MLVLESVSYAIGSKIILPPLSYHFKKGHLYGILGPNGAGKSTLLKAISGIWKPAGGKIYWNHEDLHLKERIEISKIVSLVPQNPQISFDFSIYDMAAMGLYPHKKSHLAIDKFKRVEKILREMGLWELRDKKASKVSMGERQKVYIARALVSDSPIILFDEPTASLDIQHQHKIWHLLKELAEKGKIVITTTHDLWNAKEFCQNIIVLNQENPPLFGTPDMLNPHTLEKVFGLNPTCPLHP